MYPLDAGRWGPTVRITHLREELSRLADLDVVEGYRGPRRVSLARYAVSGRLRGLDGVYVESSSFLPAEADIAFLGLARALRVPVLTYVRDAYQLFDDYGPPTGVRGRLGRALFRPAIAALRRVSSRMAFPTRGLATAVLGRGGDDAVLLPPGSPTPVRAPEHPDADQLLFVGDARLPAQGAHGLLRAVGMARDAGLRVGLTLVCRPGQEPLGERPGWLTIERAEGEAISALLPRVMATVIPRPRNAYNDLALPIKLFDYLAYGRPLLVTDCTEQAAIVNQAGAGIVMGDTPEAIAEAIGQLLAAPAAQREAWSTAARDAARAAAWTHRARRILDVIMETE